MLIVFIDNFFENRIHLCIFFLNVDTEFVRAYWIVIHIALKKRKI